MESNMFTSVKSYTNNSTVCFSFFLLRTSVLAETGNPPRNRHLDIICTRLYNGYFVFIKEKNVRWVTNQRQRHGDMCIFHCSEKCRKQWNISLFHSDMKLKKASFLNYSKFTFSVHWTP